MTAVSEERSDDLAGAVEVREAEEHDVPAIHRIFETVYGGDYPYQGFFDDRWLKRSIYDDDMLMLVAELDGEIVGTASVVCDVGAHSDLIGEFGRLVVHPQARGRGIGKMLMARRVDYTESRLHVGIVENRTVHAFSQRASEAHQFRPAGFLPLKLQFGDRESVALYVRHFGVALSLRRNHPHIAPEVYPLAHMALSGVGLPVDAIVDEHAPAYPHDEDFEQEELTAEGMPSLLRIERGRLRNREVFGPMRLHYGFFKLSGRAATYLVARQGGRSGAAPAHGPIAGAIGFLHDEVEHSVRVFELIAPDDSAVRFLLQRVVERCQTELGVQYIEIDVGADAPRMQRTLLELGFVPAAYVPALVFHEVERLDVVKMVRLLAEPRFEGLALTDGARGIAEQVMGALAQHAVLPRVERAIGRLSLFRGLSDEQATRLATACAVCELGDGAPLFAAGEDADRAHIVIEGAVQVSGEGGVRLAEVGEGDVVGELALLSGEAHSLCARAAGPTVTATLTREALQELGRRRPDIGMVLYRNFALALGDKLRRTDRFLLDSLPPAGES